MINQKENPIPASPIEPIEILNRRLVDYFGNFETGDANWKIIWSEDFFEKRLSNISPSGIQLQTPEPMTVRKCNYIKNRFILCKLVPIPPINQVEMLGAKVSYEPLWTFENFLTQEAIAPEWGFINELIHQVNKNMLDAGHKAPEQMPEELMQTEEAQRERVNKLMEGMFGNESKIGDALSLDSAVGYGPRQRKDWLN